ncbi:hypothetical protein RRG08_050510 [Elysia crispata]|uniref:Uncharacterized protein n=1 Tax=Elysia crispata TaxID=231223 RepID=A0AAE0XSK6_9GAST|nr:hypothetical protein RRG08_050510 [Elysia crispata]
MREIQINLGKREAPAYRPHDGENGKSRDSEGILVFILEIGESVRDRQRSRVKTPEARLTLTYKGKLYCPCTDLPILSYNREAKAAG